MIRTPKLTSRAAFFADTDIDEVEARNSPAETGRHGTECSKVPHLILSYKVVRHAFQVRIHPYEDVHSICVVELRS